MAKSLHPDTCDKGIFSALYEKYAQTLTTILRYKYGDNTNPADKVQEAFITLWENCKKVAPKAARSYLYTVAGNKILNEIKHQKVVLKYQNLKPGEYDHETPEFVLRKKEFLKRYQQALADMKEDDRIAFLLNKIDGKTHQQVADELGITKKVAEHRIYGALHFLKSRLKEMT
ncbi:RNA polymerase sigma-70 factor [Gangjinia marincola]|uniref:RNA polymerase sigma-70 factor n=1 Tax=Gangjinia marincola TaxID=578463 RepID=A0ABN1MFD8_9FLAO